MQITTKMEVEEQNKDYKMRRMKEVKMQNARRNDYEDERQRGGGLVRENEEEKLRKRN